MPRELGAFKEGAVGWCLVGGLVLTIISAILMWMFSVAGVYRGTYTRTPITNQINDAGAMNLVPLAFLGFTVGILLMLGAVGYGLWSEKTSNRGHRRVVANFRVQARYCYDASQQLICEDWDIDVADRPRFYVRGVSPDGLVGEYECTREVYYNSGEGMTGEAELQGKWLGRFTGYIGAQQPPQNDSTRTS